MDSTANKTQQSGNNSNIVAEQQHFSNGKLDYNVTSQDYLLAFEKKGDANTDANEKVKLLNKKQRSYVEKNMKNINAQECLYYFKRKYKVKHKQQEINTEKETSFLDAQKTNKFCLTNPLGWNEVSIHFYARPC